MDRNDTRMKPHTDRHGRPASLPPTGGEQARIDAYNAAWNALTDAQKAAYMALPQERKSELDKMTAAELTAALEELAPREPETTTLDPKGTRTMKLLPLSLGKLADLADRSSISRPALAGIQLRILGDGTFHAAATDGKKAIIVTGPRVDVDDASEYPMSAPMIAAPNGEMESIVPADAWKKAFTDAAKLTKKTDRPILKSLAVSIGKQVTTLGANDGNNGTTFAQPANIEGYFPRVADIIPATSKALAIAEIDPRNLSDTLDAITAMIGSPGNPPTVSLELHDGKLLALRAGPTIDGIRIVGAVALIGEKATKRTPAPAEESSPVVIDAGAVDRAKQRAEDAENDLKEAKEQFRAEMLEQAENIASAEALLESRNATIAALETQLDTEAHRLTEAWKQIESLKNELAAVRAPMTADTKPSPYYAGNLDRLPKPPAVKRQRKDAPEAQKDADRELERAALAEAPTAPRQAIAVRQIFNVKTGNWQPA